jgi:hypothetical protein
MASIPQADSTVCLIYRAREQRDNRPPRAHLGASQIGRACEREAWYAFRWADYPYYDGRLLSIFDRGQREEAVFIRDLRDAGVTVHAVDPETGRQFTFSDFGGHFGGSMDGAALGLPEAPKTWHVLEFKTHSSKSFAATVKNGVEKAHPEHYAQMQLYMGWSGMERALYLAVNKDTDEIHAERLAFDRVAFAQLREKAERIIFSVIPQRISESPAFFVCKTCNFHSVCHGGRFPRVTCRTCAHSTPDREGNWQCERHKKTLTVEEQRAGCPQHLFHPHLMPVDPLQARPGWVCYKPQLPEAFAEENGDLCFYNAEDGTNTPNDGPRFNSRELEGLSVEQLPPVLAAKRAFGGTVTHAP